MINPMLTIFDIENAYRKLKSYVYYDNFFIYLRERVAQFEADGNIDNKLNQLLNCLNNEGDITLDAYFKNLLETIEYTVIPKSYKEDELDDDFIITNKFTKHHYDIEKVNYLIDAPIEIHLISVLWILHEGKALLPIYAKSNYAYALQFDSNKKEVVEGLRLFKPYFEQYQLWRDKAIETAQHFVKDGTDILMISIDVKQFFYNISLKNQETYLYNDIRSGLNLAETGKLHFTPLLLKIIEAYQSKLVLPANLNKDNALPIGMLSSGIIGNWFLSRFDKEIIEKLSPAYYGRYVDDVLIVLSNTKAPDGPKPIEKIFKTYFEDRGILLSQSNPVINKNGESKQEIQYKWKSDENIVLQKDKITVYAFDSKESKSVLEKFKKKIEKNSSAFWFLPDEDDVNNDFDESVYELTYSDTVNKLRSIQGIKQSKYGASIFLAKKIKLSLLVNHEKDEKTKEQILTFFKGRMNLEFKSIWEKTLTYFVITNEHQGYWYFVKETLDSINKLEYTDNGVLTKIKRSEGRFLENCIALSLALKPSFYNDFLKEKFEDVKLEWFKISNSLEYINKYRHTNLFRHYFVSQPLLNYTNINHHVSYIDYNIENYKSMMLDTLKFKYSPRFVYLHEFIHLYTFIALTKATQSLKIINNTVTIENLFLSERKAGEKSYANNNIYIESFESYYELNFRQRNPQNYIGDKQQHSEKERGKMFSAYLHNHNEILNTKDIIYDAIEINKFATPEENPRVAIANIIVKEENIGASMLYEPLLTVERRKELIDVLNQAEKCKADILVLPEVSIPYYWIPIIADEARRKQRVIIGGLEHIRINDVCYNLMVTCIPIERNGIKDVITIYRLKNHYSPHESSTIRNRGKIVPIPSPFTYDKFIWKKIHFSVYNCYELTDIKHRSIFRSEVDMLFASEYNKDINYFANITESISRDVHCYFIQVNSSDLGDSRITKPSRTETKDIMRLKGGKNSVVLYDVLDLKSLRDFQSTLIDGQVAIKFKNTPPNFDHKKAESRLKKE
jgi:hypothetical protein